MDDELKDWVWGTAHKKWRDFKSYLKEKYFEEEKTDEDLHACRDDRVTIDDWEWLITFWRGEEFQVNHITRLQVLFTSTLKQNRSSVIYFNGFYCLRNVVNKENKIDQR